MSNSSRSVGRGFGAGPWNSYELDRERLTAFDLDRPDHIQHERLFESHPSFVVGLGGKPRPQVERLESGELLGRRPPGMEIRGHPSERPTMRQSIGGAPRPAEMDRMRPYNDDRDRPDREQGMFEDDLGGLRSEILLKRHRRQPSYHDDGIDDPAGMIPGLGEDERDSRRGAGLPRQWVNDERKGRASLMEVEWPDDSKFRQADTAGRLSDHKRSRESKFTMSIGGGNRPPSYNDNYDSVGNEPVRHEPEKKAPRGILKNSLNRGSSRAATSMTTSPPSEERRPFVMTREMSPDVHITNRLSPGRKDPSPPERHSMFPPEESKLNISSFSERSPQPAWRNEPDIKSMLFGSPPKSSRDGDRRLDDYDKQKDDYNRYDYDRPRHVGNDNHSTSMSQSAMEGKDFSSILESIRPLVGVLKAGNLSGTPGSSLASELARSSSTSFPSSQGMYTDSQYPRSLDSQQGPYKRHSTSDDITPPNKTFRSSIGHGRDSVRSYGDAPSPSQRASLNEGGSPLEIGPQTARGFYSNNNQFERQVHQLKPQPDPEPSGEQCPVCHSREENLKRHVLRNHLPWYACIGPGYYLGPKELYRRTRLADKIFPLLFGPIKRGDVPLECVQRVWGELLFGFLDFIKELFGKKTMWDLVNHVKSKKLYPDPDGLEITLEDRLPARAVSIFKREKPNDSKISPPNNPLGLLHWRTLAAIVSCIPDSFRGMILRVERYRLSIVHSLCPVMSVRTSQGERIATKVPPTNHITHQRPLFQNAIHNGNIDVICKMAKDVSNIVFLTFRHLNGGGPVAYALSVNQPVVAAVLMLNGATVNQQDLFGMTPVHRAVKAGNISDLKFLLQWSPRLDLRNNLGLTPLEMAEQMGKEEFAKELMKAISTRLPQDPDPGDVPLDIKAGILSIIPKDVPAAVGGGAPLGPRSAQRHEHPGDVSAYPADDVEFYNPASPTRAESPVIYKSYPAESLVMSTRYKAESPVMSTSYPTESPVMSSRYPTESPVMSSRYPTESPVMSTRYPPEESDRFPPQAPRGYSPQARTEEYHRPLDGLPRPSLESRPHPQALDVQSPPRDSSGRVYDLETVEKPSKTVVACIGRGVVPSVGREVPPMDSKGRVYELETVEQQPKTVVDSSGKAWVLEEELASKPHPNPWFRHGTVQPAGPPHRPLLRGPPPPRGPGMFALGGMGRMPPPGGPPPRMPGRPPFSRPGPPRFAPGPRGPPLLDNKPSRWSTTAPSSTTKISTSSSKPRKEKKADISSTGSVMKLQSICPICNVFDHPLKVHVITKHLPWYIYAADAFFSPDKHPERRTKLSDKLSDTLFIPVSQRYLPSQRFSLIWGELLHNFLHFLRDKMELFDLDDLVKNVKNGLLYPGNKEENKMSLEEGFTFKAYQMYTKDEIKQVAVSPPDHIAGVLHWYTLANLIASLPKPVQREILTYEKCPENFVTSRCIVKVDTSGPDEKINMAMPMTSDIPADIRQKFVKVVKNLHLPLLIKILNQNPNIVYTSDYKCDFPNIDNAGPVMFALSVNQLDVAKILMTYGASPDHLDDEGWTPLQRIASIGKVSALRLLLQWGANPMISNPGGETAAEIAKKNCYDYLVELLDNASKELTGTVKMTKEESNGSSAKDVDLTEADADDDDEPLTVDLTCPFCEDDANDMKKHTLLNHLPWYIAPEVYNNLSEDSQIRGVLAYMQPKICVALHKRGRIESKLAETWGSMLHGLLDFLAVSVGLKSFRDLYDYAVKKKIGKFAGTIPPEYVPNDNDLVMMKVHAEYTHSPQKNNIIIFPPNCLSALLHWANVKDILKMVPDSYRKIIRDLESRIDPTGKLVNNQMASV